MEKIEVVSIHEYTSQLYNWWNSLPDSWKDIFNSNYAEQLGGDTSIRYTEGNLLQIIIYALHTESISIVEPQVSVDSSGLRELRDLRELQFYTLYKANEFEQRTLHVNDLKNLNKLEEITLHIRHCHHLQDILLLNLPSLKRIYFLAHESAISYGYVAKEEMIIDSLKEKTKVAIELQVYFL